LPSARAELPILIQKIVVLVGGEVGFFHLTGVFTPFIIKVEKDGQCW